MGILSAAKAGAKALEEAFKAEQAAKAFVPVTAADRAAIGKKAAEATAKQTPTRMSEALGNANIEGKKLRVTQTDRTAAKHLGGAPFSMMQEVDPRYAGIMATWGVKTPGAAKNIANQSGDDVVWSTLIGSPTQHRSNELIFEKLYKSFQKAAKQGDLSEELRIKFNNALEPLFGEGADILDPKLRKQIDTFEKRAAVGNLLLGEGLGGAQRGGSIIPGAKIMAETTEPMLRDVETFSIGPRLFTLNKGVVTRPDIHPAFPEILQGEDLKQLFVPAPNEIALPTFNEEFKARTGRKRPGYYDLTMTPPGQPYPTQDVTEKYLRHLERHGYAKGGLAADEPPKRRDVSELTPIARNRAGQPVSGGMIPGAVEGLFNTLAGAAKGATQATLGMPGDINELLLEIGSAFPNAPKPYTSKEIGKMLPSAGKSQEASIGEAAGEFLPLPAVPVGKIAKSVKSGAQAVAPRAGDLAYQFINKQAEAMGLPLEMGVVKPKGGNWLAGSVERVTEPMKTPKIAGQTPQERIVKHERLLTDPSLNADQLDRVNYHLEVTKGEAALDKWVDKKLNSYIKNEMGTPEDQIRLGIERRYEEAKKLRSANQTKLDKMAADIDRNQAAGKDTTLTQRDYEAAKERFAEDEDIAFQGLYHGTAPENGWDIANLWEPRELQAKREKAGFPAEGMGKHPAAKDWENKTDAELSTFNAGYFQDPMLAGKPLVQENPWINKLSPEDKINRLESTYPDVSLEFRHMIDEVKTAMDPASNLPKHLKIAAKDLEKMTVDDVSALSGKISAWRNAQKGKANLELANNPAVSLYKEYPTANNPKGVSWRQIKRPEGLPDEEADKALRDAIGYEGDIMRHCVGGSGHCEPLLRGETEVYSLRDAKGEPHVTIEVEPAKRPYAINASLFNDGTTRRDSATRAQYRQYVMEWRQRNPDVEELTDENVYQALREAGVPPVSPSIVEIKGKNNRKPKDEYIPFIQDFIKSGNWSNVGDLHHTDLRQLSTGKYATDQELKSLLSRHYPDNPNMTPTNAVEHYDLMKKHPEYQDEAAKRFIQDLESGNYFAPPEGMKRGGAVRMAEGGEVPKAPSNWTDYLSQHAQEESMRLMGGDTALNPMKDGGSIDDMIRNAVEKANARNYASGGASLKNIESEEGLAPYGLRHSGEGAKGKGYFGVMPGKRGMVTELSTEAEGIGEHPLIVPTLTREELEYLLAGGDPTEPIYQKAYKHAQGRKSKGKGAFADPSELRHPEPEYADGGVVNIDDLIRKAVTIRNQNA